MESYTYHRYVGSFREWLALINYAASSVDRLPRQIEEFFTWMGSHNVHSLGQITRQHVQAYYEYMKYTRKSQLTGTLLKSQTLNGHIRGLKLFSFYLEETQQGNLVIDLPYEEKAPSVKHLLTAREVQLLY